MKTIYMILTVMMSAGMLALIALSVIIGVKSGMWIGLLVIIPMVVGLYAVLAHAWMKDCETYIRKGLW